MNLSRLTALLLLLCPLLCVSRHACADDEPDSSQPVTDQIVRLSFVDGDVRVARGKAGARADGGADWGQAQANLPLQTGFSLVTGAGRAEIELEDTSVIYLAPDSVLSLDLLADQGDVPHTVLTLVSGMATLHVEPDVKGESFVLNTPASRLVMHEGNHAFVRVESFLNATRFVSLAPSPLAVGNEQEKTLPAGEILTYQTDGKASEVAGPAPGSAGDSEAAWDAWTIDRVRARDREMAAALRDSGLKEPVPGLNQLEETGHFFSCSPYGRCWVPDSPAATQPARYRNRPRWSSRPHLVLAQFVPAQFAGPLNNNPFSQPGYPYRPFAFPCFYGGVTGFSSAMALTGINPVFAGGDDWALCHAGYWIGQNTGYVWVANQKRHHHCPVRWFKVNGKRGFVPLGPDEGHDKRPFNLSHGVFFLDGRSTLHFEHLAPDTRVHDEIEPPRAFRGVYYPALRGVAAPHPFAHTFEAHVSPDHATGRELAMAGALPIRISSHADEFSVAHQQFSSDGHSHMVTEHFGGSAGVARAASPQMSGIRGGFTAARGSSFSSGGSVAHAAASSGGGASAGGAHGGGGGAGGGAHGGGAGAGSGGGSAGGGHR